MNTEIDWSNFKVRCSAISKVLSNSRANPVLSEVQEKRIIELEERMNNPEAKALTEAMKQEYAKLLVYRENSKKVILSDTAIEYLMEAYAWETKRKRPLKEMFEQQQMKKGKLAEEDSITLLSRVDKILYLKNQDRICNEFLSGEPDLFAGDKVMEASKIIDIKTCWDYPIFLKKINNGLDSGNKEQVQGYCDISGASEGQIAFTLVNMPDIMRLDFKRKMFYEGNYVTEESVEFLEKWEEVERSMVFDDIPIHQRVFKVPVAPFSPSEQQRIYDRVKVCREWLFLFDSMYQNLNL